MPETIEESVHVNHLDQADYEGSHVRLTLRTPGVPSSDLALTVHELHFLCESIANARGTREPSLTRLWAWAEGALRWSDRNPGKVTP